MSDVLPLNQKLKNTRNTGWSLKCPVRSDYSSVDAYLMSSFWKTTNSASKLSETLWETIDVVRSQGCQASQSPLLKLAPGQVLAYNWHLAKFSSIATDWFLLMLNFNAPLNQLPKEQYHLGLHTELCSSWSCVFCVTMHSCTSSSQNWPYKWTSQYE